MPDHMDGVQEHAQKVQDNALADTLKRIARAMVGGLSECIECGAPISDLRKSLGARQCMPCATASEVKR